MAYGIQQQNGAHQISNSLTNLASIHPTKHQENLITYITNLLVQKFHKLQITKNKSRPTEIIFHEKT
jgi:hypothetical protein